MIYLDFLNYTMNLEELLICKFSLSFFKKGLDLVLFLPFVLTYLHVRPVDSCVFLAQKGPMGCDCTYKHDQPGYSLNYLLSLKRVPFILLFDK